METKTQSKSNIINASPKIMQTILKELRLLRKEVSSLLSQEDLEEKFAEKRIKEEKDTDEAVKIYKQESKMGKLKLIKSLRDLD